MEKYMTPEMEIVAFESEDIITSSGGTDIGSGTLGCGILTGSPDGAD